MNYVKFIFTDKGSITINEKTAMEILQSDKQVVPVMDSGAWTMETVNKAYLVRTQYDSEYTRKKNAEEAEYKRIREQAHAPRIEEKEQKKGYGLEDLRREIKNKLKINKINNEKDKH